MNTRTYKVTNTGHFEVALATDGEYGYFEHNALGEELGGGLWFKDGAIYDYDGVYQLPPEVVVELENRGVDVTYLKESKMTEDEYQLEEIYEVVFGDNGINRYLHEELIELLAEMQDCYEWVCNFKSVEAMRADLKQLRGE